MAKTTVELPDLLLRRAKAASAQQGITLKKFFSQAVTDRLKQSDTKGPEKGEPAWVKAFAELHDIRHETRRISRIIEKEFEKIDEEDWR